MGIVARCLGIFVGITLVVGGIVNADDTASTCDPAVLKQAYKDAHEKYCDARKAYYRAKFKYVIRFGVKDDEKRAIARSLKAEEDAAKTAMNKAKKAYKECSAMCTTQDVEACKQNCAVTKADTLCCPTK